jgi:catechol 2,3-dioxygenase-like lactoylglutathione lyase family enzyme
VLDHVGIRVSDRERSKRFYAEALAPLGYELVMEHRISGVGFGRSGKPDFWIREGVPAATVHVAFAAGRRGRLPRSGRRGGRARQRPSRASTRVPPDLLRGLCSGSGWQQRRSRLSQAGRRSLSRRTPVHRTS